MKKHLKILALATLAFGIATTAAEANCSGSRDTGTAVGAVGGGLIGNGISHGSLGGTVAGAVIGGVAGNAIGGSNCDNHRHYNRAAYNHRYYRDRHGSYWVDSYGHRHYR